MDFAKGLRPHSTKQTALPMPSDKATITEIGDGSRRVTDTLTWSRFATYLQIVGQLVGAGVLEAPVLVVMHHPGGFRIRVERDAGASKAGVRMGSTLGGFVASAARDSIAAGATFEMELECGCGVRVEVRPDPAPSGVA